MKKEIPSYVIIVAILLVVAVVGYFGYKVMNPQVEFVQDPQKTKNEMIEMMKKNATRAMDKPPTSPATTKPSP